MRVLFAVGLSLLVLVGCAAGTPQALLPISPLAIDTPRGPAHFSVELAVDPLAQQRGLMFRTVMAPDAGMLFDFGRPVMTAFWMKNTILPLDLLFIRADGTVSTIAANAVPYSETPIPAAEPVRAVLEINAGRAKALGIEPGAQVHHRIFGNRPAGG